MSKTLKISISAIVLTALAYLILSPYFVIYQIRQAVERDDVNAVASYVDFPSVRQSFKDQFNNELLQEFPSRENEGSFVALGAMLASSMVDKMVDLMVTPQGISLLLQGKKFKEGLSFQGESAKQSQNNALTTHQNGAEKVTYHSRYQSWNQFSVEIDDPKTQSSVNLILNREGLSWRVTEIMLPITQFK